MLTAGRRGLLMAWLRRDGKLVTRDLEPAVGTRGRAAGSVADNAIR
jgi:hypothetical protein